MRTRAVLAAAFVAAAVVVAGPLAAAETPGSFETVPPSSAPTETELPLPPELQITEPSALINPAIGKPGDTVIAYGINWPAAAQMSLSVCGNRGLGGSSVCASGGTTLQADGNGAFSGQITLREPPYPCPCVVQVATPRTTATIALPVTLTGVPSAPVQDLAVDRRVSLDARITGSGPALWSWFGGSAERTVEATIENLANEEIPGVQINVSVGKGDDPTDSVTTFDAGAFQPGQVKVVAVPVEIEGPTFGSYTAKVSLTNVDTVNAEAVRATTSVYPWLLILLIVLLAQPFLLGLYKKRPIETDDDDPFSNEFGEGGPSPEAAAAAAAMAAPAAAGTDPHAAFRQQFAAVGAVAAVTSQSTVVGGTEVTPTNGAAPVDGAGRAAVFGVTDLRSYLDPAATQAPETGPSRVVLGGLPGAGAEGAGGAVDAQP
jgi:hypothetical protein